ncbi:ras-related protein Rab-23-like [Rhynchophorus ferrugineus]|uniref:ras-related protein Rab-23-like n=1 Tax=Rhynchophorus ferrugineus TaxID=354439 RepID=UPI003FCE199D
MKTPSVLSYQLSKQLNCHVSVENECGEIPTVIVQNKIDLIDQSVVSPEEAELLARALGCRLVRTSVKEDLNVTAVFRHLAQRCLAELRDPREEDYSPGDYFSVRPSAMHNNALNINAFHPSQGSKNSNGTIVLQPHKHKKKKNVLKNACRIL